MGALLLNEERVCEENQRLVHYVINRYFPSYRNDEDFFQEAWLGLWESVKKFDESRGVKFSTFAVEVIKKCGYRELRRRNQIKRRPMESLNSPIWEDGQTTQMDLIPDGANTADSVADKIYAEQALDAMKERLSDTQLNVLDCRIGGQTQREISESVGICLSQVQRSMKVIKSRFSTLWGNDNGGSF